MYKRQIHDSPHGIFIWPYSTNPPFNFKNKGIFFLREVEIWIHVVLINKSEILSFIGGLPESSLLACQLFDICIDEALNVRIARDGIETERSVQEIAADAARNCQVLLNNIRPDVSLTFRGVSVNQYLPQREKLRSQLDRLIAQCSE